MSNFVECGLDADWLLSQREIVNKSRIERFVNSRVEGRQVELRGLVLPLDLSPDGRQFTRFLLTPQLGKCSHEPPPSHNQVVLIDCGAPIDTGFDSVDPEIGDLTLSVAGPIRFVPSSHCVFLIDGLLRVDASYMIDPCDLKVVAGP